MESAWEELNGSHAGRRRDLCLDAVGDVLETGRLTASEAERAVERLIGIAVCDEDHWVRESALHAVCTASTHYALPYRVVEPLAVGVDAFEPLLLPYVLAILGCTHDQAALPAVERFLQHSSPDVRREAEEAVSELHWSRGSARPTAP
ncbi:hypothetical protein E2C00_00920 [Streptomyces sp. WAC05374]|nr:hypothetical protein EF905_00025 [Streptomyces sp. WAC05374]TDF50837.1 hypothetical protein E2B92_00895 [Streptomyces sp. WAC05374]TDF58085.1 hypothetical protein E2C02_08685 [Streptomyces sp. WAC05374]TDF61089.1 hypothetical protein E2C00_00920 [Streptomyces sp. WAC05374]